ncbi:MAG: DegT/DnrJ/EryC1/StrS family aminotransferase [Chloroflexota bacterium]|nr:DegT/DnrJ/EryC1/StrS family aminotransferase [Chloroflexota bacterium]
MNIPLSSPDITELEISYVTQVLRTPNLSLGPKLVEFEARMAQFIGVKHAVAVNSGTSALHLIIRALEIKDGDEVITTPFSFISSANCMLFERAKPVFVDIEPLALNIDVTRIEEKITGKTRAILAVDVFGYPVEWNRLEQIAKEHHLKLIEDSCEALGAEYQGKKLGTFGEAAAFAFYPNKQMTTGEGGIIVTNNEEIAKLCRSMRNQGRGDSDEWLEHQRLGYNYRISDINCALGIAQLERIEELLAKREQVAQMYNMRLKDWTEARIPFSSPEVKRSWFVYVVTLADRYSQENRDNVLQELRRRGIGCSNYFTPIHLQPFYVEMFGFKKGDFPVTEHVSERTIALPFYNNLSEDEIDFVVRSLKEIVSNLRR